MWSIKGFLRCPKATWGKYSQRTLDWEHPRMPSVLWIPQCLRASEDPWEALRPKCVFLMWLHTDLYLILPQLFSLIGLCIGQMRLIFALPDHLRGRNLPKYHACIEWFNAFHAPNPDSLLYSVTRSRCNNAPVTEIVPLTSIISSCYLTPRFGTTYHPARWSSTDVLEECKSFTLNKYISLSQFYELKKN